MTDLSRFDVSPARFAEYRAHISERRRRVAAQRSRRSKLAWAAAREAAGLLRARYEATRVIVFGSLASGLFHSRSDVDLIAWGIDDRFWLSAPGDVYDLHSGIELNLVLAQDAPPSLRAAAEAQGIAI